MHGMPTMCMSCLAGYIYSNGSCMASNCSLTKTCTYCPTGFGLMADQDCQACPVANCSLCNMHSNCTECLAGFYRTMNNSCMSCPANCYYCYKANTCQVCMSGFTSQYFPAAVGSSSNQECVACSNPCATCLAHPSACLSCQAGFVLFGTQCIT